MTRCGALTVLTLMTISRAAAQSPPTTAPIVSLSIMSIDDFIRTAISRHPRIVKAGFAVESLQGKHVQAGLYPNPLFSFNADELGDRTGQAGILTPRFEQEIVRGDKLRLSQAIVAKEIDQANLAVMAERYAVIGAVRAAYFEVYALQERRIILAEFVRIGTETAAKLKEGNAAPLDLVQVEIEREMKAAELKALEAEIPAAFRRLAAVAGESTMPPVTLLADFTAPLPAYDAESTRVTVLATHPESRSARVAVEKAHASLRRAQAEPKPNLTVATGYTRQSQNQSNDWLLGVSLPLPTWNKNQGAIQSAVADIQMAQQDVCRVENELADRVATTFRTYASSKQKAEWYRDYVIGRCNEALRLTAAAREAGQFNALQVLQAQKAAAEAKLEMNKALGDAWKAAGELSGLLLEEQWPPAPSLPRENRVER